MLSRSKAFGWCCKLALNSKMQVSCARDPVASPKDAPSAEEEKIGDRRGKRESDV